MPAKSKAQQRMFGIAHAVQQGKIPASKVKDPAKQVAKDVKKREVKKFATTDTKNLPDRVKKEIKEMISELVNEMLTEYKEQVLFAVKKGDPDWKEQVLTNDPKKFEDAKKWAAQKGFHKFRVATIDLSKPPDFKKTLNLKETPESKKWLSKQPKKPFDPQKAYQTYVAMHHNTGMEPKSFEDWKKMHDARANEVAEASGTAGNLANRYPIDKCTACQGKGYHQAFGGGEAKQCPACQGKGYVHSKNPKKEGVNEYKVGGFQCLECGKKYAKPVRKCSKCGSSDIDIAVESKKPSQLEMLEAKTGRPLSVFDKHALAIAYKTMKMPDAMVGVMGGPTKDEAKATIKRITGKDYKERKESVNEYEGPHPSDAANYWIECPKCKYKTGIESGEFDSPPPHDKILCPKCKTPMQPKDLQYAKKYGWKEGRGMQAAGVMEADEKVTCPKCSGSGKEEGKDCYVCRGSGKLSRETWEKHYGNPATMNEETLTSQELEKIGVKSRYNGGDEIVTKDGRRWGFVGNNKWVCTDMKKESVNEGITYVAIYNGKEIAIANATSLYDAKKKAIERFKPAKSKEHMISVQPAEKDGEPIKHVATEGSAVDKELDKEHKAEQLVKQMILKGTRAKEIVPKLKSLGLDKAHAIQIFYRVWDSIPRDQRAKIKYESVNKAQGGGFKRDEGVPVKEQYKFNPEYAWLKKMALKNKYQIGPVTVLLAFDPKKRIMGINAMMIVNPTHPAQDAPRHIEAALDSITGEKETIFKLDKIAPHKDKQTSSSVQKLWLLPADKISTFGQKNEVAPKGWEGTVKAMKKHKEIDNPWALAHYMKGQGMKSHKKEGVNEDYYNYSAPSYATHVSNQSTQSNMRPNVPVKIVKKTALKNENGDIWYLTYIDPTHFSASLDPKKEGHPYHIGQMRDHKHLSKQFVSKIEQWLKQMAKQGR